MSGSLRFDRAMPEAALHDHFDLVTTQGVLRLNDPRRFGAVVYARSEAAPEAASCWRGWAWSRSAQTSTSMPSTRG